MSSEHCRSYLYASPLPASERSTDDDTPSALLGEARWQGTTTSRAGIVVRHDGQSFGVGDCASGLSAREAHDLIAQLQGGTIVDRYASTAARS